ncbi:hypothetical protein A5821_000850 [Enterococcus sp. 7F3_DIV0205]|uniref:Uncharacterized protein n=1 Tax=Candidatus Enterococcus palustris TaxID=1834189 RepID=A0AAQ3W6M9_9ENTE|nr:hypothetical protein [Enterococcus sp. 7F3_DIV0205]OTN85265.1 hypothetical protein A5821_001194 [Enterococcus sp. 7F3_DIV0205]
MTLTEEDLAWLNQYVYNVDEDKIVNFELTRPKKNKILEMRNGTKVWIVDVTDDNDTGFQGMAVAPIINGKPDYNQVTVVAAATDSSDLKDLHGALSGTTESGSHQYDAALDFIKNLPKNCTVSQLTGYSQSAFMLKAGAKLKIPATVFNGWFQYTSLNDDERKFIRDNPGLFLNYRHASDWITMLNDRNSKSVKDLGTIVWVKGSSHNIYDWDFDGDGRLIVNGDTREKVTVRNNQIKNNAAILLLALSGLANKLRASGGGLSSNEEIFLDNSEALIVLEAASQTMYIGLQGTIKVWKDSISEAEELWKTGVQTAESVGEDLNPSEVMETVESGSPKASIVNEPTNYYEEKIAEAKQMNESYDHLIDEIKESINQLIASDQELAKQLQL